MVQKEDFIQWRNSSIHQEFQAAVNEMVSSFAAELVNRTETNESRDMFIRGAIKGLIATLEWEPEFIPAQENEEEA